MKLSSLTLVLLLVVSSLAMGQRKKKEDATKQAPTTVVKPVDTAAKTDSVRQNPNPVDSTSSNQAQYNPFTQHYANKYSLAIQFNDYEMAKDALYDLIVENPANDSIIYDLAYYYFQNQKYASAVLVSQVLIARNSKHAPALEIAAIGYDKLGALDRSQQCYESLYLINNDMGTMYKVANLQYRLKRYTESIASIEILLSSKEIEPIKVALSDGQNKSKEYPLKVAILNLRGLVCLDQLDKVGAKKYFEQALALAPDYIPAKENMTKLK